MESEHFDNNTGPHRFEMDGWISLAPYERLLNITIIEAGDGIAQLRMPFLVQYAQGAGLMHGGALISLADTAMVMAIKSTLPPYTHFVTTHIDATYLKAVTQGTIIARAALTDREDRVMTGQVSLFNQSATEVLACSAKFKIVRPNKQA